MGGAFFHGSILPYKGSFFKRHGRWLPSCKGELHELDGRAQGERSAAFRKIIKAAGLEMTPFDDLMESTRARGEDLESQGCARHAPTRNAGTEPRVCANPGRAPPP